MMIQIGIPQKYVTIIKYLYNDTNCAIISGGQLTDWFPVNMGVRQGCIMSPSLFNIFIEHVMKGLTCLDRNLRLDDEMSIDIRYADDTTLVSAVFEKLQIATSELENACHKWGLTINPLKCAVLTTEKNDIKIGNNIVPKVNQFKFLGSLVPNCPEDVLHRISIASQAFGILRETIWTSSDVSRKLKIRLYKALILPIAIYGSDTWTMRKQEVNSLLVFEMKCLRAILRVTKYDRLTNTNIRKSLNVTETIE